MTSAPFRQQIDKERGVLRIIETRYERAVHNLIFVAALVAARDDVNAIAALGWACSRI
jgi:hypothetical protein